jgi:hypothetical protein
MRLDESVLGHPEKVGDLAPCQVFGACTLDNLAPSCGQGVLLLAYRPKFVAYVHDRKCNPVAQLSVRM